MTSQEKKLIFNLLKTASDSFYGYSSPEFLYNPDFKDDVDENPAEDKKEAVESEKYNPAAEKDLPVQNSPQQSVTSPSGAPQGTSLQSVTEKIHACTRCKLANGRLNVVPGMGVEHPEVLVVGEGPGEEEDKQGLPFVGPAGQLLDKMLAAIQLSRSTNCYIANTVKCRPPYNRDPEKEEAEACRSFLDIQINILKPKMILAVGKVALRNLLHIEGEFSMNRYRGQIFEYNKVPLVVTYHPSALLRNADFKKPAWEDLKFFKTKLEELSPDYAKNFTK